MPKRRRSNSRREGLLDAAEAVSRRLGAAHLTLDAVAAEAGVSKGGLIYHFPSKLALLEAVIERAVRMYADGIARALVDRANAGDEVLAHVQAVTGAGAGAELGRHVAMFVTVSTHYPELMRPLRSQLAKQYAAIMKQAGAEGVVAMLAVNGLFLMEHLGVAPFGAADRRKAIKAIRRIAEGE